MYRISLWFYDYTGAVDTAVVAVGNFSLLKRNIRNYRHRHLLGEPMNSDFNIPEEWKTTGGGTSAIYI